MQWVRRPEQDLTVPWISAYLLLGLTFVMLLLHLYNDIPQLNLGHFLLRGVEANTGDPERMRLSGPGGVAPKYTQVSSWESCKDRGGGGGF